MGLVWDVKDERGGDTYICIGCSWCGVTAFNGLVPTLDGAGGKVEGAEGVSGLLPSFDNYNERRFKFRMCTGLGHIPFAV